MPRIPTYDTPQVESRPVGTPYQHPDAGPDAFGASIGQGLQHVAGAAAQASQTFERAADDARFAEVADKEAQFKGAVNSILHDKDVGYTATAKGQDAAARFGDTQESLESARQAVLDSIKDPATKAHFDRGSKADMLQANEVMQAHAAREHEAYQVSAVQARMAASADTVSLNPNNDKVFYDEMNTVRTFATAEAQRRGLQDTEEGPAASQFVKAAVAGLVHTRIEALLHPKDGGDPDGVAAKKVFDENREVLGVGGIELGAQIENVSLTQQSDKKGQEFFAASVDPKTKRPDEAKAIALADAMPPGKLRERVVEQVKERFKVQHQIDEVKATSKFEEGLVLYQKTGSISSTKMTAIIGELQAMSGGAEKVEALRRMARADSKENKADASAAVFEFMQKVNADPDGAAKWATGDVTQQLADVPAAKRAQALTWYSGWKQRYDKDQGVAEGEFSTRLKSTAAQTERLHNNKDKTASFVASMQTWRGQYLEEHGGKPPTRQEVDAQMAWELTVGDPGMLSANKFRFEYKPGEEFKRAPDEKQLYAPSKAAPRAASPGTSPPRITGEKDYAALPSGASFIGPDGKRRRKP